MNSLSHLIFPLLSLPVISLLKGNVSLNPFLQIATILILSKIFRFKNKTLLFTVILFINNPVLSIHIFSDNAFFFPKAQESMSFKHAYHFSDFPKENIVEDIILDISSGNPPPLAEVVLANGSVTQDGYVTTYFHKVTYHLYRFKSVYYRCCYTYNVNGNLYALDVLTWNDKHPAYVVREVDKLVALTAAYTEKFFGDAVLGCFSRFVYLPNEILEYSTIAFPSKNYEHYIHEILGLMGVKNYEIAIIDNLDYIFGRETYTVLPVWKSASLEDYQIHHSLYGDFLGGYGGYVLKSLGLDKVKANLFALQNRNKGMKRYVENFKDCREMIEREHPGHNFTMIPHGFGTITDAARHMVQVRWLFGPGGSNLMHALYMQPGGCVCFYLCDWLDCSCSSCCSSRGVFSLAFMNSSYTHMGSEPMFMDLRTLSRHINRSLQILKDQHL